jgi:hypothetical protein
MESEITGFQRNICGGKREEELKLKSMMQPRGKREERPSTISGRLRTGMESRGQACPPAALCAQESPGD